MNKSICSHCGSNCTKKNGHTHYGKQNHYCHDCNRQFVEGGQDWFIPEYIRDIIENLLKERISLAGIARSCKVSESWLYTYIQEVYGEIPPDLNIEETAIEEEAYLDNRFEEEIERMQKKKESEVVREVAADLATDLDNSLLWDGLEQDEWEWEDRRLFEELNDWLLDHFYNKERSARVIAFGIQLDELWSFVGNKKNKQWIWLALNPLNRQIVGFYIGKRNKEAAAQFMETIPLYFRENACFFTDYFSSYPCVIEEDRHFPVGKDSGLTSYIERFNNTLRQRVSRLVRKGLSFSKSIDNHIKAIKYFICDYNANHTALQL